MTSAKDDATPDQKRPNSGSVRRQRGPSGKSSRHGRRLQGGGGPQIPSASRNQLLYDKRLRLDRSKLNVLVRRLIYEPFDLWATFLHLASRISLLPPCPYMDTYGTFQFPPRVSKVLFIEFLWVVGR